jgi:hypothetical protein
MRRTLFAEQFLTPVLDSEHEPTGMRYDAKRGLNLGPHGQPAVELGLPGLATRTSIRSEADDFNREASFIATDTKQVPGEPDDVHRYELRLATETRRRESDDFARDDAWAATPPSVRAEGDDFV